MSEYKLVPLPFLKFLEYKHVPSLLSGNLRFGSLQKYRILEILSGDSWIGDRREGLVVNFIEQRVRTDTRGNTISENMSKYIRHVEAWAFCMSMGSIYDLVIAMARTSPAYSYDSCTSISDIQILVDRVKNASYSEGRISDFFGVYSRFCVYRSTPEVNFVQNDNFAGPNPFLKDLQYIPQCEYRILLVPKAPIKYQDDIFLSIGDCSDIMQARRLSSGKLITPSQLFTMDLDAALLTLQTIVQDWYKEFPDVTHADAIRMDEWHERLKPIIGDAYGSMRFRHGQPDEFVDMMFVIKHWTPDPIYRALRSYLSDRKIHIALG